MSVVRGTALANYPSLVAGLGGDPATLLRAAGVRDQDVGNYDAFISIRAAIRAIESAAAVTATMDFGRRLAQRQGIEILGPVGVAARTAATVGDALAIFNTFMAAYSPVIAIRITPLAGQRSFIALEFLLDEPASYPQTMELALGVALGVIRLLLGADYAPLAVHLPHDPLTPEAFYLQYFGCRPYFAERVGGFTMRTADLSRPLNRDDVAHRVVVDYLSSITPLGEGSWNRCAPSCASCCPPERRRSTWSPSSSTCTRKRCNVDLRRRTPHSLFWSIGSARMSPIAT